MDINEHERLPNNVHFDTNSSKGTTLLLLFCIHSHIWVFNNEQNSNPEISVKRNPLACSWAVPFTTVDKSYILAFVSFWSYWMYLILYFISYFNENNAKYWYHVLRL